MAQSFCIVCKGTTLLLYHLYLYQKQQQITSIMTITSFASLDRAVKATTVSWLMMMIYSCYTITLNKQW